MSLVTLKRTHPIRSACIMMFNPGEVLKTSIAHVPWPFSLAVSMLAFMLLFLQTGLDLVRTGQKPVSSIWLLLLVGAAYGIFGIGLLAGLAWLLAKLFGGDKTFSWAVSAFGLSYSSSLIYGLTGLLAALFLNWNTAIAFGVTGVLWATGPVISSIREMVKGKMAVSVIIATICSSLLLLGWSFIGNL